MEEQGARLLDASCASGNASAEDCDFVRSQLGNHPTEQLKAVWTADVDEVKRGEKIWLVSVAVSLVLLISFVLLAVVVKSSMIWVMAGVIPLSWVLLLLRIRATREYYRHVLYYITTHAHGTCIKEYSQTCGCAPGRDTTYIPWNSAMQVTTDNKGSCWCSMRLVTIGVGQQRLMLGETWIVSSPDEVANAARTALREWCDVGVPVAVATAIPVAQSIRVFASLASDPEDRRVVMLQPDASWEDTLANLGKALDKTLPADAKVQLCVPGGPTMKLTSTEALSANDAIVIHA